MKEEKGIRLTKVKNYIKSGKLFAAYLFMVSILHDAWLKLNTLDSETRPVFAATVVQILPVCSKSYYVVDSGRKRGRRMGRGRKGGVLCQVELAKDKLRVANSCYMCTDCPKRVCNALKGAPFRIYIWHKCVCVCVWVCGCVAVWLCSSLALKASG